MPDSAGTMPVPVAAEAIVDAYRQELDRNCRELTKAMGRGDGGIRLEAHFVTPVDVNGDGRADLFMTSAGAPCDGAPTYDSGSAGHGARWAVSTAEGTYRVSSPLMRKAEIQETLNNGYQVIIHLHGLACGRAGASQCRHVVRFDRDGQMHSLAWPDGRDSKADQDRPAVQPVAVAAAPAAADVVDLDRIDGASFGGYDHNGSVMWTALSEGLIVYAEPKAAVRDVVKPGSVLFRGKPFQQGGRFEGTAYAFKKGCAPAPYAVRGSYSRDNATITLRGAGPVRQGCDVVGYSERSPHAVLKFTSMMSP
ncbi:hypothetical protein [Bosea sp. MMO-172]|uniref:hypothetical protein n=1 Tax=Bosea sp. MMO-172 TaxID=3127885 RepID=UPI00301933F3